jgi:chloramphenicol O-acetyltransferase type A
MSNYLDLTRWARREVFEFFRSFDKPYFNVCTQLDVTELLRQLRGRKDVSISLAYHYFALRIANEVEPFRYRLKEGKVLVHEVIHGGTTLLLPNETFTLCYFDYYPSFADFLPKAMNAVREVIEGNGAFEPLNDDARIHCTVLPWFSFTSFSHARNWQREDSIPKLAFGKFQKTMIPIGPERQAEERILMPFSVEVHHALMDGLHVGQYLTRLQEEFSRPEGYLSS